MAPFLDPQQQCEDIRDGGATTRPSAAGSSENVTQQARRRAANSDGTASGCRMTQVRRIGAPGSRLGWPSEELDEREHPKDRERECQDDHPGRDAKARADEHAAEALGDADPEGDQRERDEGSQIPRLLMRLNPLCAFVMAQDWNRTKVALVPGILAARLNPEAVSCWVLVRLRSFMPGGRRSRAPMGSTPPQARPRWSPSRRRAARGAYGPWRRGTSGQVRGTTTRPLM